MNLILLLPEDFSGNHTAILRGRRLEHLQEVLKANTKDTLCVGKLNGEIGSGTILRLTPELAELSLRWHNAAPEALPLTLIIALPRPKMLKRILQAATSMGVKEIYFINAWKVEKSFWQSPWLLPDKIEQNCILGLEQGKDTVIPKVHLKKLFKPFVEDELPAISESSLRLVAHPGSATACPRNVAQQTTLVIGPEGGFTPYEIGKLTECGFQAVHLGARILKVETAVTALLARLF